MRNYLTIVLFFTLAIHGFAQQYKISGTVRDASNGQTLPGVSVFVTETQQGESTDANGAYHFTLQQGTYHLKFSLISYKDTVLPVKVNGDTKFNVALNSTAINANTVNVI